MTTPSGDNFDSTILEIREGNQWPFLYRSFVQREVLEPNDIYLTVL